MRANLTMSDRQTARANAENAEGLRDSSPEAQRTHGRVPQDRRRSAQEALGGFDETGWALGATDAEEHVRDEIDQHEQQEAAGQESDPRLTSRLRESQNHEDAGYGHRNEEVVDRFLRERDGRSVRGLDRPLSRGERRLDGRGRLSSRLDQVVEPTRLASRTTPYPAPAIPARANPKMLVVTQVRQALQQTAAIGAFSPYFPAA
jgi:hypothetical protein